jgi:hypothetical protein
MASGEPTRIDAERSMRWAEEQETREREREEEG